MAEGGRRTVMRVARTYAPGDIRLEEMPVPRLEPGELLVRITVCGVCSSDAMDWYVARKAPAVLGHEPVGVVEETTPGADGFEAGERVFVHHHAPCMECRACLRGYYTSCRRFRATALDPGGYAEFARVPAEIVNVDVLSLPDEVSDEAGVFIEPLGCGLRAFSKLAVEPGRSVWLIGAGPVGLLNLRLARHFGAEPIIVSDPVEARRAIARSAGADLVLDPGAADFGDRLAEATDGWGAENVIVGPGSVAAFDGALPHVAPGAVVLLFTPLPPDVELRFRPFDLYFDEITIAHSYSAGPVETRQALDLIAAGAIEVEDLVTDRFGLDGVGSALELAHAHGESLRSVIYPHGLGVEVKAT